MTIALSALIPSLASAQLAQTGRLEGSGGGLGSQLTLLTLSSPGSTSAESGCITPTATSCTVGGATFADVGVQNGQSQVQLLSNAALSGLSGDNIRIIVNLTEPNTSPETAMGTLNDLRVILYGSGGNVLFSSVGMVGTPIDLTAPGAGIGNFGFTFGLTGGDIGLFNLALQSATSIGVAASLTNVTGGLETINVARATNVTSVVPEPSTYALMAAGLGALLVVRRRRKKS